MVHSKNHDKITTHNCRRTHPRSTTPENVFPTDSFSFHMQFRSVLIGKRWAAKWIQSTLTWDPPWWKAVGQAPWFRKCCKRKNSTQMLIVVWIREWQNDCKAFCSVPIDGIVEEGKFYCIPMMLPWFCNTAKSRKCVPIPFLRAETVRLQWQMSLQ